MSKSTTFLSKYYGESGDYLKDHDLFLHVANIKKDIDFLIKALNLKRNDNILDIACGQGRHSNVLAKNGFKIDGVDFSQYLLDKAKEQIIKSTKIKPNYYLANIEKLKLKKKYDKAYWFFSDLANINISKAILSINKNMRVGGKVLFDTDNIFRILSYLQKNPKSQFIFDATNLELIDKKTKLHVQYPVLIMWNEWFISNGFVIEKVFGNYNFSKYTINSPRLIIVVKKTA